MIREWFDIPGWEGYYQASIYGQIRSVERIHKTRNRWGPMERKRTSQILRQFERADGNKYLVVSLYRDGRNKPMQVSRLVLSACVRLPEKGEEACHGNHDRQDNRLHNLEWGTHAHNEQQKTLAGRRARGPRWSQHG
jgi:hypothetical protein